MTWLIQPKTHPLLLLSPFSLLFSFIYITHSNPPLLYFPSLSPSVTLPRSHVTLSPLPLLLPPVPLLPCLLIPCLSSPHPLLLSPVPLLLCLLLPCLSSPHPLLLSLVPLLLCLLLPCLPSLSCKECLPVLSTGAFTLSKTGPFKHAEHAFLAPWRRPSCM